MIIFAAGDPGGSRAIMPVAGELLRRRIPCAVVEHGFLGQEWPAEQAGSLAGFTADVLCAESAAFEAVRRCRALVFGSSVADVFPLQLARYAHSLHIPVMHVLDNWGGYADRLRTDGQPPLMPTVYAVMDAAARDEAIADGVPENRLTISGHPGLAGMAEELRHLSARDRPTAAARFGLPPDKLCLAFVNEPFRSALGADVEAPGHPGFTEDAVLAAFAAALAPHACNVFVVVLPHPKQTDAEVADLWRSVRGNLDGTVLRPPRGRDILPAVSGISGMASLLLYESWLSGLPVLCMQPGCRNESMKRIARLDGVIAAGGFAEIRHTVAAWLNEAESGADIAPRPELNMHLAAPAVLADAVQTLVNGKP